MDQCDLRISRECFVVLRRAGHVAALLSSVALVIGFGAPALAQEAGQGGKQSQACPNGNVGITLPPGFCATVFADNIGHARHLVVAPNGVVYVNTWSGRYYHNGPVPKGGFLVALRDSKGTGHADIVERFGQTAAQGAAGGVGIALYKGGIYAEEKDRILRYSLKSGSLVPEDQPEVIVSGMPVTGDHPMHPFVIDKKGSLYVDLGSATNSCQAENRMLESTGEKPCKELETRGGIWRYDANKTGQHFSPLERFATGLRNGEGLSFDAADNLYDTQHGRDQLYENWPRLYKPEQGHNLPAEELVQLTKGANFGWPECYFDGFQKKLVLAPEYGGDGGKKVGVCAKMQGPVAFFPAHWAPNDMLIYTGTAFPKPYQGGAFIAFHGSWNRAPAPQGGYNVVFQPLANGKSSGKFIIFADGFAGAVKEPGKAAFRPSGLAMGPHGALYISDDVHGRIWRVTYRGSGQSGLVAAQEAKTAARSSKSVPPPEGIHANAGRPEAASLPVPAGMTQADVAEGGKIFHGANGGTCSGCHGSDAKGTSVGPDLTSGKWAWGDGSLASITAVITKGVQKPKNYTGAMPPKGGAPLSEKQVVDVAAYVWAISHSAR